MRSDDLLKVTQQVWEREKKKLHPESGLPFVQMLLCSMMWKGYEGRGRHTQKEAQQCIVGFKSHFCIFKIDIIVHFRKINVMQNLWKLWLKGSFILNVLVRKPANACLRHPEDAHSLVIGGT